MGLENIRLPTLVQSRVNDCRSLGVAINASGAFPARARATADLTIPGALHSLGLSVALLIIAGR